MHIGKKILDDIQQTLFDDYDLNLTAEEYEIFTNSFAENHEKYYHSAYKARQCTSFGLMKKILQHDRKEKILLFLSDLAGMEPQIQELQPWNRDHIVHAIHTFFIGVYLLKRINFPENQTISYNPALMWKLIGPTHDLGYPIEIAGNIHKGFIGIMNGILSEINPDALQLKQKACPANLEVLCDGRSANDLIQKRLDEWKLGIDVNDYYEWLQERNRVDHGVIGALAQLKVMDALCQERDTMRTEGKAEEGGMRSHAAIRELDMASAAAALFVHNIDPSYPRFTNRIDFHAAPIAFLLFLCDTFQEWDRYADRRTVYPGEDFDIEYQDNQVVLSVPSRLATSKCEILQKRLGGMPVIVNQQMVVQ